MQITDTKIVSIPLSQLVCNEGQIDGVPANPRILRDEKYRALVASLRADNLTGINPLKVYWYETDGANKLCVVLGGNMRLRALQEIGATECPCIEIPQDTPTEVLRKIVVLDNSTFGEWDWDILANEWDDAELKEWGLDLPKNFNEEPPSDLDGEQKNKPFAAKLVFVSEIDCKRFIADYKNTLESKYNCTISISGGEL